jgi:hypothetical protein
LRNLPQPHGFAVPVNHSGAPRVQHLRKSRYRIVHGFDPACRLICARRRRTRRRTRGFFGNGSLFATRWFGGYRKCADQWYCTRSCELGRNKQYEDRSQRHRQCCQDDNAATAEHSCPDAAERFANSGRTSTDDRRTVNAGGGIRDPSPAGRRSSAIGKRPDESEQSSQPGERGGRSHARHLPRLLNIRSAIRRDQIRRDAKARKTVAQVGEIEPDFRISQWVARSR